MSLWVLGLIIAGAGAAGGILNALLTDNGFVVPKYVHAEDARVWKPGFIGNIVIGAAAAFVTWGLYGRWAGSALAGAAPDSNPAKFYETLSGVTGAFLAGIGGARVLTGEVDKQILKLAAHQAATNEPDPSTAAAAAVAPPAATLAAAMSSGREQNARQAQGL
jgi:hypothetical protein